MSGGAEKCANSWRLQRGTRPTSVWTHDAEGNTVLGWHIGLTPRQLAERYPNRIEQPKDPRIQSGLKQQGRVVIYSATNEDAAAAS